MSGHLNMLVNRCLTHGVIMKPYQQKDVFARYEKNKIPDEVLAKFDKEALEKYVRGLYLSSQEMAGDWTKGHEILMSLGFERKERQEGHRCFVSLEYVSTPHKPE